MAARREAANRCDRRISALGGSDGRVATLDLLYRRMRAVLLVLIVPATVICVGIAIVAPERWGAALVPHQRALALAFAGLPVVGLVAFLTNAYAGGMARQRSMTSPSRMPGSWCSPQWPR